MSALRTMWSDTSGAENGLRNYEARCSIMMSHLLTYRPGRPCKGEDPVDEDSTSGKHVSVEE